jgi:hypothetical protein
MGYHVSIVRTAEGKAAPINQEEIRKFAEQSSAFRVDRVPTPGGHCMVLSCLQDQTVILGLNIDTEDGRLWTKNPTETQLKVMIEVASAIGARVRGDEYETYKTASETYTHPDDLAALSAGRQVDREYLLSSRRKRKIWLLVQIGAAALFVAGVLVAGSKR